jgi:hypothetical protein
MIPSAGTACLTCKKGSQVRSRLRGLGLSALSWIIVAISSAYAQSPIHVGENVLVSGANPEGEHTEYAVDADPNDPRRLMVCSMVFSPTKGSRLESDLYLSDDGGQHWSEAYADTTNDSVFDPSCVYDAKGNVLFTVPAEGFTLHRSIDGGRSWIHSVIKDGIDAEHITVDHTGGRFGGRIYINGNTPPLTSLWVLTSTDGGKSFHKSASTPVSRNIGTEGRAAVLPDGTLLIPGFGAPDTFVDMSDSALFVTASRDGGEHLDMPVEVRPINFCVYPAPGSRGYEGRGNIEPTMAADRSDGPYRGRAYLVYGAKYNGHCAVFASYSDDHGQHWSRANKVSDEPTWDNSASGPDIFLPEVAINDRGVVGVTWYDRREDPARDLKHRLRFTASLDGGVTWLLSQAVSTAPFDYPEVPNYPLMHATDYQGTEKAEETHIMLGPRLLYGWNGGPGDYAGFTASADGRFHAFWIDNRTGVGQMYTAAIDVDGTVWRNGAEELASLNRATPVIKLSFTRSVWDPATRSIGLVFHLQNRSADPVVGPLKMRITKVFSDLGKPKLILQPSGEVLREGSVIDMTSLLPPSGLPSGAWSNSQRLEARFDPLERTPRGEARSDMLWLETEFFASGELHPIVSSEEVGPSQLIPRSEIH